MAAVVEDFGAKRRQTPRRRLPDPTQSKDARTPAAQAAPERDAARARPLASPDPGIALHQPAMQRAQQEDRQVRNIVRQDIRRIGYLDAVLAGCREVDGIDPNTVTGDQAQLRKRRDHFRFRAATAGRHQRAHPIPDLSDQVIERTVPANEMALKLGIELFLHLWWAERRQGKHGTFRHIVSDRSGWRSA